MKHPCHFCGHLSDRHRWVVEDNSYECFEWQRCEERRRERAEEQERLGNEGAVA